MSTNKVNNMVLESKGIKGFKKDFVCGLSSVLIAAAGAGVYVLGPLQNTLNVYAVNFTILSIALAGVAVSWIMKLGWTGKNLSPLEVFQDFLVGGMLAATSTGQALLQVPASFPDIFLISHFTATAVFILYFAVNAAYTAVKGKHLSPVAAVLMAGTPYLFGWLLLLGNIQVLHAAGSFLPGAKALLKNPLYLEVLGRLLVVFIFNEVAVAAIRMATRGRLIRKLKTHLYLFFISLLVVFSPYIANAGSTANVAALPLFIQAIFAVLMTGFAHAPLWGETYMLTGMLLDGVHGTAPDEVNLRGNIYTGMKKGLAFSGIFMAVLYITKIIFAADISGVIINSIPLLAGAISGALIFPFLKNLIETFDGSKPFMVRLRYSYRNWVLYARGAVFGLGMAYGISSGLFRMPMSSRILFGLLIGVASSGAVSFVRDIIYTVRGTGKIQTWKLYFFDIIIGGFVGSAMAFYLDTNQVPVIIEKFRQYTTPGFDGRSYITFPLLNKWGMIDLGVYTGGVKLLYTEALAGVLNWSVAAWLFAVNRVFMEAYFKKDRAIIRKLFSKEGAIDLVKHLVRVMRWGLWMAPIIFTFLRMMPEPTWYNQDGLIRTFFAIFQRLTSSTESFAAWSLNVFLYILIYDFFRILIWVDHMGLRVATLVNWSFLGLDRLDEKIARFIGPIAAQKYIPEAIKRFVTWAPLLIPFYMPAGDAWEHLWTTSQAMQTAPLYKRLLGILGSMPAGKLAVISLAAVAFGTGVFSLLRIYRNKRRKKKNYKLRSGDYTLSLSEDGKVHSTLKKELYNKDQAQTDIFEYDITRRSYDLIDPCGRAIFIKDSEQEGGQNFWPVAGNYPSNSFKESKITKRGRKTLRSVNTNNGIETIVDITLPEKETGVELWKIRIKNLTARSRSLKVIPYLEWVLNGPNDDRFHPQYSKLFPQIEYVSSSNAVLAWQKKTKLMGFMASDFSPSGYLNYRLDFIGRARSLWDSEVLGTLEFREPCDTPAYPTFDPIGALLVDTQLEPEEAKTLNMVIGCADSRESALEIINRHIEPRKQKVSEKTGDNPDDRERPVIGHGKIPEGTPQPYTEYVNNEDSLVVKTPYTPRPFDHQMCNSLGHAVMVTNRGLHTTCSYNSQQNRITPDCSDIVTREIPGEAFYIYDVDNGEWFSPAHHPINNHDAENKSEFSVEGTAVYRMGHKKMETEFTVFVPPEDPAGIYMLKIKNNRDNPMSLRVAPYFQMVLGFMPEQGAPGSGMPAALQIKKDKKTGAVYYENPSNSFRKGPAFVSMTEVPDITETKRGRFFGTGRGPEKPFMPEQGKAWTGYSTDTRPIAGFLKNLEIPAGKEYTLAVVMGQAGSIEKAEETVNKYKTVEDVKEGLEVTRKWWKNLMSTVTVKTNREEFDHMLNWLKYQDIVDRVWARRGFYQSSGAYGFRDQLQDTINIMWVDPVMARRQIILHASQQFIEGDVFHWFFTLPDGSTSFASRSHASDNLLWLVWGTVEYLKSTGDYSILDELTSYVYSEDPFEPLPKNPHGIGGLYGRSTHSDTIYRHCMKSIDLVFNKRTGVNGLPLIGAGDWNDGLDEIGSQGRGESVWLGLFLHYILKDMLTVIEQKDGKKQREYYDGKLRDLKDAIEKTWRGDRYLRAFHDDGTEIGVEGSGIWEIDALTAAWAVICEVNPERSEIMFNTAIDTLEKGNQILLGWPALNEHSKPYLGRSCVYPEGVRENGMYCHGVQWLIKAARMLAEKHEKDGNAKEADRYRETAYRLWRKITPLAHTTPEEIEVYGGQPNKQQADVLTNFDPGRMIWNGYTGSGGWLFREAMEGVIGAELIENSPVLPDDLDKPRGELKVVSVERNLKNSPL